MLLLNYNLNYIDIIILEITESRIFLYKIFVAIRAGPSVE